MMKCGLWFIFISNMEAKEDNDVAVEMMETRDQNEAMSELIPGYSSLDELTTAGFKALVAATKCSNRLPQGKSRDIYESYPTFHSVMSKESDNVLVKLYKLMKHAGVRGNIQRRDNEEKFEMVVESNDCVLEKVGSVLDEIAGVRSNPEPELVTKAQGAISGSWNHSRNAAQNTAQVLNTLWNATKGMEKPQVHFKDKIDNSRNTLFEPSIKYKHNLLKPLAILLEEDESGLRQYSHPYEFELERFNPPAIQLNSKSVHMYKPLDKTPLNMISTIETMNLMLQDLRNYTEIALDLEHHSYRSFQGFTCLMQVSTRDTDYVVDTLQLRGELHVLNEVLTDPKIVKVLHGADNDVKWLQCDLGLYVVNLFDTHQAAKALSYPHLSLAYLLNRFCQVDAQKHFQLADWRIRPLPDELVQYAREDTHYLLYIYDLLKQSLITAANGQTNLLMSVISQSTQICLTRYMKPEWDETGYINMYHRSKRLFDNRQQYALKHLYDWCDATARQYDESPGYVLPYHMMLHISETLPREVQGILACCNPIPALVRQHVTTLHSIILRAREQPLVKPVFAESQLALRGAETTVESPLRCPHDLTRDAEFRDDLPTLLASTAPACAGSKALRAVTAVISVLDSCLKGKIGGVSDQVTNLTPYQRYKLVKPFTDSEQAAADAISSNARKMREMEIKTLQSSLKPDPDIDVSVAIKTEPIDTTPLSAMVKTKKRKSGEISSESEIAKEKKPRPAAQPEGLKANPYYCKSTDKTNKTRMADKGNRKKHEQKQTNQFQPFDYSAVDFKKFKSSGCGKKPVNVKKDQTKIKHSKKSNKKKFKLPI